MQGKIEALKKSDTRGDLARESEHMRNKRKKTYNDKPRCFLLRWKFYKGREKYSFTNNPESTEHSC